MEVLNPVKTTGFFVAVIITIKQVKWNFWWSYGQSVFCSPHWIDSTGKEMMKTKWMKISNTLLNSD